MRPPVFGPSDPMSGLVRAEAQAPPEPTAPPTLKKPKKEKKKHVPDLDPLAESDSGARVTSLGNIEQSEENRGNI